MSPGSLVRVLTMAIPLLLPSTIRAADPSQPTVLTGNQATYSLASALTRGTPIAVLNIPKDGRRSAMLKDYIDQRMQRLAPIFAAATAVISLGNALPGDPIYRFARDANIRIVNIDAAVPWSLSRPGVALVDSPVSNVDWATDNTPGSAATAPYIWLSIANAIRMGDIIAHDLIELFPDEQAAIKKNLDSLKWSLLNIRNEYQNLLIEAGDDTVFALTGDFIYLTNDMGLYVDGYFIKQDIHWSEDDYAMLTRHLVKNGIRVVIHKWMPSAAIQRAVSDAGAQLVVLDSGDAGRVENRELVTDGLQQILRKNLDAVYSALSRQAPTPP